MFKRALLIAALFSPQVASAADFHQVRRHHHLARRASHYVEQNNVISCTTSNFVLFSYSNCGQGFDPMAIVGY